MDKQKFPDAVNDIELVHWSIGLFHRQSTDFFYFCLMQIDKYSLSNLELHQLSDTFSSKIWVVVQGWDYFAKDTLGKQLVRAADSISFNIAEGNGRHFYKENIQFCYYSRGSLTEVKSGLSKAFTRKLITEKQHKILNEELDLIHKKLYGYISFLVNQFQNTSKPINK